MTKDVNMHPAAGHPRRRSILAVLCLSLLIVVIDNTVLNTALPTLARELHASTQDLQWIVDAYTLVFAALLIVAGWIGDRFGRRGALLAGLTIFAAGSIAAALSNSPGELIAFRAVMGVGGAFVMPATLSILAAVFPPEERPAAIGIWSAMAGVGIVIGPTLGGLLLAHFSWASVFWLNVPLVLVAVVAVFTTIPSLQTVTTAKLDVLGGILSALTMIVLVDAVIEAPERGWLSATTLIMAAAGAVLAAAFIARELTAQQPLIDVRIFARPAFSAASAAVTITFFSLFGSLFALTQFLQFVKGYGTLDAGLAALPFAAAVLVTAPLSTRLPARTMVPVGLTLLATGLLGAAQMQAGASYAFLAVALFVMGAGLGLTLAPAADSIMGALPAEQAGVGSAINDTVQELGGTLGVAVIGSVVAGAFRHTLGRPAELATAGHSAAVQDAFTHAMSTGFTIAAAAALGGAVAAYAFLPRERTRVSAAAVTATTA